MSKTKDWNVCFEIGLSHMGSYSPFRDLIMIIMD